MLHFCTYFRHLNYIHRGLALYRSLESKSSSFMLWTLCFDDRTYEVLRSMNFSHMRLIQWSEFEENDEELIACKNDRTRTEYYWTCSPSLPLYLFRKYPEIELLCYVDADYFFFSNPKIIFDTMGKGSIFIIPHDYDERRFGKNFRSGKYNVGVLIFRKDRVGLQCLELWRN